MRRRLANKQALVTGAAAGIGRATALAFAAAGADVIAVDIHVENLRQLAQTSPRIQIRRLDVTQAEDITSVHREFPRLNVLVNAVGFVHNGNLLECSEQDWSRSIAINLLSMVKTTTAWLPDMIESGGGSIINVASVASSIRGVPSRCAYSTTKAAVIGLTKSVAADFVTCGIRCNAICPGTIDTPSFAQRMRDTGDEAGARTAFTARQPMGRLGTAEEVAALALYLASDEAAFTTGSLHVIDGGWTM